MRNVFNWIWDKIVIILLGLLVLVVLSGGLLAANNQRHNCEAVEKLKAQFRIEANESYANLDRDGKLLGIKITDELRDQARRNRDATLERFKATECQGFFGK